MRVMAGTGLDVEMPSFVDDMWANIIDWDGGSIMQRVEVDVKRIVREVAEECNLPIETDKEEVLHTVYDGEVKHDAEVKHQYLLFWD